VLQTAEPFDAPTLDRALHEFVEREGIQIGQIIHAVRVAVTGKAVGFGLFETLALLGRERCLQRIDSTITRCGSYSAEEHPHDDS
jgi:glutamyl-tRNA synthetase